MQHLSPEDLDQMRKFYQEELDKTVQKLTHINSILEKIGGTSPALKIEINGEVSSVNSKSKNNVQKTRRKKKRGPKSVWEDMILKRLKLLDKPLTYDELTDEIMHFGNLPEEKRRNTKLSILNVTHRLRSEKKKIDTFSTGSRIKYIALQDWFGEDGAIKPEYLKRATPIAPAKTTASAKPQKTAGSTGSNGKRRGRPPKSAQAALNSSSVISASAESSDVAPAENTSQGKSASTKLSTSKKESSAVSKKTMTSSRVSRVAKPRKNQKK